jgi:hypothetical protein
MRANYLSLSSGKLAVRQQFLQYSKSLTEPEGGGFAAQITLNLASPMALLIPFFVFVFHHSFMQQVVLLQLLHKPSQASPSLATFW